MRLFLSLLGLPHEVVSIDLAKGEHRTLAFLEKNPRGQVPVIEDGDVMLADSTAILVYLATRYDDGAWLPRDPLGAAQVQHWLALAAGPIVFGPNRARLAARFKAPVDAEHAKAIAALLFVELERELAGRRFALGDGPTIADVAAYSYVAVAPEGGIALEPYPHVRAWLANVEGLPGFVPMPR